MANQKISALNSATTTDGTEVLPVVQSAETKKMATSVIKDWILGLPNLFTRAQTIQPSQAETALTVRRATSGQTEDILMVQAQDNTVLARIDKDGKVTTPALLVPGSTSGTVTVQAAAAAGTYALTLPTSDGDSGQYLKTDGSGVLSWDTPVGGGTPGGSNTQVQFNDGGAFGGDTGFTYDKTADALAVAGSVATSSYQLSSSGVTTDATTSRTLSAADNGKVIYFTSGSAITVTTAASLGAGFSCVLLQGGAGQITVAQGASTTMVSYGSLVKTAGQYAAVTLLCPVADTFVLMGQTA